MDNLNDLIIFQKEGGVFYNQWVEWKHSLIPNSPTWLRKLIRYFLFFSGHCLECTVLSGCYFVKRNIPKQPLHPNCHCKVKNINTGKAKQKIKAMCDISKFTDYIFSQKQLNGKKTLFESWGYTIHDSQYLVTEYESQAVQQYLSGNYVLKNLDKYGQRIAIRTTLNGHTFYSGWMIYPEGLIKNTTTFGGKIK